MEANESPELFQNALFRHLVYYQQFYLPLLAALLLLISYGIRLFNGHPLLLGAESYFYADAYRFLTVFPLWLLALCSVALGTSSVWLLLQCCRHTFRAQPLFTFLYGILVVVSPAFLWTFSTISGSSVLVFCAALGWHLLLRSRHYAPFPLAALLVLTPAALIDFYSALLLACFMLFLHHSSRQASAAENGPAGIPAHAASSIRGYLAQPYLLAAAYTALLSLAGIVMKRPFIAGPFALEDRLLDLISDLGTAPGASIFLLLLGIIGFSFAWKKKEAYFWYAFLAITLAAYLYRPLVFFPLLLFISLFATHAVLQLFQRPWLLPMVRNMAFLLLCLGLLFSTLSYFNRVAEFSPTKWDHAAMVFMEKKTPAGVTGYVLAEPEQAYYIKSMASREPFYQPHIHDKERQQLLADMYNTTYITQLFPLLEQQNISILYVTPSLKESLPADYGFLFLLQNERFKLLWEKGDYQVWAFRQE